MRFSVNQCQFDIIDSIEEIYNCKIEADVTYSTGRMYKNREQPKFKSDKFPQSPDVVQADSKKLPYADNSISCIMYDPPFMLRDSVKSKTSIMVNRFSSYKNIPDMLLDYSLSLSEIYRVLKPKGYLIFKCQDTTYWHLNFFPHVEICNMANSIGFDPTDLFILHSKSVMTQKHNQEHARKNHSYFWLFRKTEPNTKKKLNHWQHWKQSQIMELS